jgi:stearoyl-CoA desaturase (delta-9 desaturase)
MGWFWKMPRGLSEPALYETYAADLARDPWHRFLDRNVHLVQLAWGVFCFTLGTFWPCFWGGAPSVFNGAGFVVYGVFLKTLECLYIGNVVDWLNHAPRLGGYRNYETGDRSANNGILAALHWGGAVCWHNNHHANPAYFTVKRRWWEFDAHYWVLTAASKIGLIWNIRVLNDGKVEVLAPAAPVRPGLVRAERGVDQIRTSS